jgi:glycosyltransferase involved in cell wall biosynthesis
LWVAAELERDWTGGIGRVLAGALPALAARGHEVHLAGRARERPVAPIPGVETHAWRWRRAKIAQLGPLVALQRRLRADVVHFHSALPHGAVIVPFLWLRGWLGRPAVGLSPYTGARADYARRRDRSALPRVDLLVASSGWSAERAIAAGARPERTRVIPVGVELPPEAAPPEARGPVVVALSRMFPSKGVDVLVDAFAAAAATRPGWRLRIAGEGQDAAALRARAEASGCGDRIELVGFVRGDAKRSFLAAAAIGVQPSRDDNYPGSLLELQAHGVACVGTAVGGIPDILGDGAAGVVVPPGDAAALAAALGALMDDPARRAALAAAGRRVAASRSWPSVAGALEAAYREVLPRAGRAMPQTTLESPHP